MDQGSTKKRSAVHNCAPTVTKFCVMWEGQALPHDTKFGNCRCEIVGRRVIFIWSLIHGSSWSGLIKAEPDVCNFVLLWMSWDLPAVTMDDESQDITVIHIFISHVHIHISLYPTQFGLFSIYGWEKSQPMREDIINVMSSLTGWDLLTMDRTWAWTLISHNPVVANFIGR